MSLALSTMGPIEREMAQAHLARRQRMRRPTVRHTPVIAPPAPEPEPVAIIVAEPMPTTVNAIIHVVCRKHHVTREELFSGTQQRRVSFCRHECCFQLRQNVVIAGRQISLPEIGRRMGGMDHSSVWYAIRTHERRLAAGEAK